MHRKIKFGNLDARRIGKKAMRSTLVGIFVNLGLALTKCAAGFFGHSFALIADGLESAADVVTGLVVYFGLRIALRRPDENHPYGHGKAEPIAAPLVGLSLIGAAVAIAFARIHGIITPHPPPVPYALVVLAGVPVIKEFLFRHVSAVGESIGSTAVRSDTWHHRSDAITSAFALVGVSVALVGGKGWEAADRWGRTRCCLRHSLQRTEAAATSILELGDVAPDPSTEAKIRRIAGQVLGVLGLDKCFVRKMGFNYYADLHIVLKGELSVREGHRIAHQVEDEILKALPEVSEVLVHVEPEDELVVKQITADHP